MCITQRDVATDKFQLCFSKTIMVKKEKKSYPSQSINLSFWEKLPTALVPYYHSMTVSLTAIPPPLPEHQSHHLLLEQQQSLIPEPRLTTLIATAQYQQPKQPNHNSCFTNFIWVPCPLPTHPPTNSAHLQSLCAGHCARP